MNSNKLKEASKSLKLTKEQRDIIVGLLLGDGHLETQNNGRTYRLKVEHGEQQKEYLEWLYKKFEKWIPGGIYTRVRHEKYTHVGWRTYSHGALRFYGKQFYQGKVKILPDKIEKFLTDEVIAIWFMDDGSVKSKTHKTYIFHTYCFSKKDLVILQEALIKKFQIKTTVQKQKDYWRLYILTESAERFENIIRPFIQQVPIMNYKLINKMPKK